VGARWGTRAVGIVIHEATWREGGCAGSMTGAAERAGRERDLAQRDGDAARGCGGR
jgi:hypothetical protein